MALRSLARLLKQPASASKSQKRLISKISFRSKSVALNEEQVHQNPVVSTALPTSHQTIKVLFNNHKTADFKTVWRSHFSLEAPSPMNEVIKWIVDYAVCYVLLRDNCKCPLCVHEETRQKLLDTPSLDVGVKPKSLTVTDSGNLVISWQENGQDHVSTFDSSWLYRYGQSFMHETFESEADDQHPNRPPIVLWDRTEIWKNFPEISYNEVIGSDEGLRTWLEMFYQYGIAIMRNVPPVQGQLVEVVKHFAYVKETQYGVTFDVVHEPDPSAHPAFSGLYLAHHTDMNYREKSPGMQLLHCLKATDPKQMGLDPGGMSFFVDGFRAAKWLEDNEPSAFHILTSTPVRFQIKNKGKRYSQLWPIICVNQDGDVTEIHYNNRTMGPLQAPSHIVIPFYHAYKLFTERLRQPSSELKFHMLPGDLVAFNNRRVLHGRTGFDPTKVSRHLVGCYVDIDETMSIYDSLLNKRHS